LLSSIPSIVSEWPLKDPALLINAAALSAWALVLKMINVGQSLPGRETLRHRDLERANSQADQKLMEFS